jgi:hypothetical protein
MATSLVVLSHGLWGVHGHMGFLEQEIRKEYKDNVHIVTIINNVIFHKKKKALTL